MLDMLRCGKEGKVIFFKLTLYNKLYNITYSLLFDISITLSCEYFAKGCVFNVSICFRTVGKSFSSLDTKKQKKNKH